MKIVTVVGARPQFIKAAVVSHVLRNDHQEVLVHTGQHYDYNMSENFFEELDIPRPDYNLGIAGGTHAQMTGKMMIALEEVFQKEVPDWLLVYGDTNSTLAAALAASKLGIPICHVEAGSRTIGAINSDPEEVNRICADHISSLLLACTQVGLEELQKENLGARAKNVGDPMYDAFIKYGNRLTFEQVALELLTGEVVSPPAEYYYLTCHREENTRNDEALYQIFMAAEDLDAPTVYPVHPRNRERAIRLQDQYHFKNIILSQPVGYLESACLVRHAKKIMTDSGGLQREAFWAEKKCVTLLKYVSWPEIMVNGRNTLCAPDAAQILSALSQPQIIDPTYMPFGDGHASERIVKALESETK